MIKIPEITIIMRGYKYEEILNVSKAIQNVSGEADFALEITENSPDAFETIEKISNEFPDILVGAGTIMTLENAKKAINSGAKFILSPVKLSTEIIDYCKKNDVVTVPAAFSPSEVYELIGYKADIIKIFPATSVGPKFFKDIQGPLGELDLMAVGGVSLENIQDFRNYGVKYFGIGSNMFNNEDVINGGLDGLEASLENFRNRIRDEK